MLRSTQTRSCLPQKKVSCFRESAVISVTTDECLLLTVYYLMNKETAYVPFLARNPFTKAKG